MPIYDCHLDPRWPKPHLAQPRALPFPLPLGGGYRHTEDATGAVLSPLVWCDTDTGEVERYVVKDGQWEMTPGPVCRVVTVREFRPAPLRLIFDTLITS